MIGKFRIWKKNRPSIVECDDGVTLVEYGIALVLAITVGAPFLIILANIVSTQVTTAGTRMTAP